MDPRLLRALIILSLIVCLPLAEAKPDKTCPYIPTASDIDAFTRALLVPVKRLHLVLEDGTVVSLELRNKSVDLLSLKGLGKGLEFSVPNVDSSGNPVPALFLVTAAHFETYARGQSEVSTPSGPLCHLKIPHLVDLTFPQSSYVRANETHLLKIPVSASKMLDFKSAGTPCKPTQLKCDLVPELTGVSISSIRDEF